MLGIGVRSRNTPIPNASINLYSRIDDYAPISVGRRMGHSQLPSAPCLFPRFLVFAKVHGTICTTAQPDRVNQS